jgi:hypothetical protein
MSDTHCRGYENWFCEQEDFKAEIADLRSKLEAAEGRIAELEQRLAVEGLPADLLAVLRDPGIVGGQDGRVFELLAEWRNAPSSTASPATTPRSERS